MKLFLRRLLVVVSLAYISLAYISLAVAKQPTQLRPNELATNLTEFNYLVADFVQHKQLANLPQPLVASGSLLLSKDKGLYWQQKQPFNLTLLLTEEVFVQQVEDGPKEVLSFTAGQLKDFQLLLHNLLTLNLAKLEAIFVISAQQTATGWQLNLTPKDEPFNKVFQSVTLTGNKLVNSLELLDQQGGSTFLEFKNHQPSLSSLPEEQSALFNP